ncbi:DUF7149 domain-containing protein [Bacillus sp. UNC438CL73TsuS30]|uniref:DUF7149 domain-containing protein n=1 Tax=Bacillus sp. UNC438CL73TsuS30 TaxID=1340434 RepID=UPI00047CA6CB|nr:TaqI-like C-terminal specificity domain-containing protein [Bacillus sp. UNC438CL73TsuS30]
MAIKQLTLVGSMTKSIQAIMPQEEDKRFFEHQLSEYLTNLRLKFNESEEHQKNLLKDFLQRTVFPDNYINTSGRTDLAIYNGASPDSSVGILIEVKSTTNKSEMMTTNHLNTKAFQETVAYYLIERLVGKNIEIKKCIITNGMSWFVINASEFEKYFVKNNKLVKQFDQWRLGQLASSKTDFLYTEVIAPAIDTAIEKEIQIAHFNLTDAIKQKKAANIELKHNNVTQLYRFFTPENLLNKKILTDSNKLNKGFYDELLYLMGLEEVKVENKKAIKRLPESKRQIGSFVENVIDRLQMNDVPEELQYDIAIQLTVVWVNRILFLKLLESQLVTFNNQAKYKFLTKELLPTFDDIYYLFFGVLAKKVHQRSNEMKKKFPQVPYLNSSLFEETELELSRNGMGIDRLREQQIQFFSKTALKGNDGKRKTGSVEFLTYLFEFLNAYDFSTSIKHKEKDKNNLINAAVLGLIFEKINGYKEGSFYTPGRITMYMSKNIIRKAVIQKINEVKGWNCKNIYDVQFKISSLEEAKDISAIIDTIKICDPAVGSGHFLVSVLNELIAIKSELRVLIDIDGRSMNDVKCKVVNDELIIQDFNGDNFTYTRGNSNSERIQRTIFHEKRKLIENCLFGVDINPNSVNICRLRLWIELLKNSYYYLDEESNTQQLITLPNIDINIKVGNSLLHNIPLDTDLDKKRMDIFRIKEYYDLVVSYKETKEKRIKQELLSKLQEIKKIIFTSFDIPEVRRLRNLHVQLMKAGQTSLFATKKDEQEQRKKIAEIEGKIKDAEKQLEFARSNPLFKNGLEWRMEFPEILDNEGKFVGFDVVIANPPYIYSQNGFFSDLEKKYFEKHYRLITYQANSFGLFLELGFKLLRPNGYVSMIIPNTFLTVNQYEIMRRFILKRTGEVFILNSMDKIFEDASVDNCIINAKISSPTLVQLAELNNEEVNLINEVSPVQLLEHNVINLSAFKEGNNPNMVSGIIKTLEDNSKPLEPNYAIVRDGLKVYQKGKGEPKQTQDEEEFKKLKADREWFSDYKKDENYWEIIKGEHIERYKISKGTEYIRYGRYLAEPRTPEMFMGERLLIRQIPRKAAYSLTVMYTDKLIMHERSLISIRNLKIEPYFALGVLNSKVVSYFAIHKYDFLQRKTFPQLRLYQIKELPIPNANEEEKKYLNELVEKHLQLNASPEVTKEIKEQMDQLDFEIDEYVMSLFKLNEEEKQAIRDFKLD